MQRKTPETLHFRGCCVLLFCISRMIRINYLFENCGALRAALRPYFLRSFIRGSRVRNPAALRTGLYSASASRRALATPYSKNPVESSVPSYLNDNLSFNIVLSIPGAICFRDFSKINLISSDIQSIDSFIIQTIQIS